MPPQRALGADGRTIALVVDQHRRLPEAAALRPWRYRARRLSLLCPRPARRASARAVPLRQRRGDFRFPPRPLPHRRKESAAANGRSWKRLLASGAANPSCELVLPSRLLSDDFANQQPLRLETAACPIPVKKQRKYNLSRWAVTGRDDLAINAACESIYRGLVAADAGHGGWKELCYLWSSDFRTHITDKRWEELCRRLARRARRAGALPRRRPAGAARRRDQPRAIIDIATPAFNARLDRRRGLALTCVAFRRRAAPLIGTLPHGHFDDIALQADWYTGNSVFEAPGEHKVTDLGMVRRAYLWQEGGDVLAFARIDTPKGPIEKTLRFHARRAAHRLRPHLPLGRLGQGQPAARPSHACCPMLSTGTKLSLTTHNGGKEFETFRARRRDRRSWRAGVLPGLGVARAWHDRRLGGTGRRQQPPAHRSRPRDRAAARPSDPPARRAAACSASWRFPRWNSTTRASRRPSPRTAALSLQRERSVAIKPIVNCVLQP